MIDFQRYLKLNIEFLLKSLKNSRITITHYEVSFPKIKSQEKNRHKVPREETEIM